MKKQRRKHHIYTIVVSKRRKTLITVIILSAIAGLVSAHLTNSTPKGSYSDFIMMSCEDILNSPEDIPKSSKNGIYTGSLLSLCSPIFTGKGEIIPVFNPTNADNPSSGISENNVELMPKQTEGNAVEKSVVSDKLKITNATSYSINASELADTAVSYNATGAEPKVLVMHTHGCETYSDQGGAGLGESGTYRTPDTEKNVVKIGELLTHHLKEAGIAAIHDKTLCDTPAYNKSYINSMELIENYKKKYPSISFVFDIHRDAIAEADGTPVKLSYNGEKEKCAQAMIVCGTDAMGLYHPFWKDNLILALKIQRFLEDKYPGFMRPVNLRSERFNMHETKGSLIFEIGTHGNTLDEAKKSVSYLAEGIIDVIGK